MLVPYQIFRIPNFLILGHQRTSSRIILILRIILSRSITAISHAMINASRKKGRIVVVHFIVSVNKSPIECFQDPQLDTCRRLWLHISSRFRNKWTDHTWNSDWGRWKWCQWNNWRKWYLTRGLRNWYKLNQCNTSIHVLINTFHLRTPWLAIFEFQIYGS